MSTKPKRKPAASRKAAPPAKANGAAKLKLVGFYADPELVEQATANLNLDAETLTDFLLDQLKRKAKEKSGEVRRVTELDLAALVGKNRATVAAMRARGDLDGLYIVKGNGRVVYELKRTLARISQLTEARANA